MKNILIIIFFIQSFNAFAGEDLEKEKYVPEFTITERKTDATLAVGTSKFKFSFYLNGKLYTRSLDFGINDKSSTETPDQNGWVKKSVKKGKYKLYFYVDGYKEVITDSIEIKSQEVVIAKIQFQPDYRNKVVAEKPVIYVYPEEKTEINIELMATGNLTFTYPKYENGWNFTATPDGNIFMDNKEYNYLFWESEMKNFSLENNNQTGFLIASDTLLSFLESSLSKMGLNTKEQADFITYWYPRMIMNEKNNIHFLINEDCNAYAELKITPQPETIIRIAMIWSKATSENIPQPQILPEMKREGFTVIEWGGVELDGETF
jgi:hypothetical protein